jgi:intracellular multiplication protein IcmE
MADMKSNGLSAFFSNPKMRIIIAAVVIVGVVAGGIIGWRIHLRHAEEISSSGGSISQAPSLKSIPGAKQTSTQYSKDLQDSNIKNEQNARSNAQSIAQGGSAVPTISQPGLIGNLDQFDTMPDGRPTCPMKVVKVFAPNPTACTIASLSSAHQSGVLASELRCQGCTCPHLKAAGYQAADLKAAGFAVKALSKCGFDWAQLRAAGFTAAELKAAGASAADLKAAGFSAAQLKAAGYSAKDLLNAGYSPKELAKAGYSAKDLLAAGLTPAELKKAGFTAAQLAAAGVSAADLAKAGYSPADIKAALAPKTGVCSISAIKKARDNGASVQSLLQKGCSIAALKAAGITAAELKAAGVSAAALKAAGFSAKQLKDAGFSAADLKKAGFSAAQLKNAGYSAAQLKKAGFSAADLKKAGFSAAQLKKAGFSAADLKKAGFSAGQLKAAGFSAKQLKNAGFSAKQLKNAGFTAGDLVNAGFSPKDLAAAGYTKGDLMRAGLSPAAVGVGALPTGSHSGTCSVHSLRHDRLAGVTARAEADKGCSLAALKAAGYSAKDLLAAGFTPTQLHDAGFSAAQLTAAGVTPAQLKAAGYTASAPVMSSGNGKDQGSSNFNTIPSALGSTPEGRLKALQLQQQRLLARSQLENKKQQIYALLNSEASQLLRGWAKKSSQKFVAGKSTDDKGGVAGAVGAMTGHGTSKGGSGSASSDATDPNSKVIKAGSIMFGILTTGINTDEQSPILAKVISGKLKGSKLMGTFSRKKTKVMLTFDKLNMPGQKKTIGFNAVAIDPNTARTVVAGHVNNHYLLKYGSMFASGFLGSLGDALSSTNKVCFGGTEGCINMKPNGGFSAKDQILIGLGGMGTKLGDVVGTKENTEPTVTVPAGASIGLLLMSDFTVPKSDEPTPVEAPSHFNHQAHAN